MRWNSTTKAKILPPRCRLVESFVSTSQPGRVHVLHPSPPLFYPCGCTDRPAPSASGPAQSILLNDLPLPAADPRPELREGAGAAAVRVEVFPAPAARKAPGGEDDAGSRLHDGLNSDWEAPPHYTPWSGSTRIEGSRRRPAHPRKVQGGTGARSLPAQFRSEVGHVHRSRPKVTAAQVL